jgi:pimeloyl-ACP methyl ester carboxylesterase
MQITSRGQRVQYRAAGDRDNPTLLLVHGLLQSANRWVEMGYLDAFATRYRVVALDLLGHGDSDKPTDPDLYTVDGHLQDLEAVLDAEGASACHIWGYSGGAVLALALAAARPERTLSTIVGGIPPNLPREIREAVFGTWIDALEAGDWPRFWEAFLPIDPPMRALLEKDNDHRSVAAFMRGAVATWELAEPGDVPTLAYMGDKELFFDDARQTAQHLGAEFAVIPGRGHAGAFQDLATVEPIARAFLEAGPAVRLPGGNDQGARPGHDRS